MKKAILFFLAMGLTCAAMAQSNTDSVKAVKKEKVKAAAAVVPVAGKVQPPTKKMYTIGLQLDSAQYNQFVTQLVQVSQDVNQSEASHVRINQDFLFLEQLYKLFESEKRQQDQPAPPQIKAPDKK